MATNKPKPLNPLKSRKAELGYTDQQIADMSGLSRPTVLQVMDLNPKVRLASMMSVLHVLGLGMNLYELSEEAEQIDNK